MLLSEACIHDDYELGHQLPESSPLPLPGYEAKTTLRLDDENPWAILMLAHQLSLQVSLASHDGILGIAWPCLPIPRMKSLRA